MDDGVKVTYYYYIDAISAKITKIYLNYVCNSFLNSSKTSFGENFHDIKCIISNKKQTVFICLEFNNYFENYKKLFHNLINSLFLRF